MNEQEIKVQFAQRIRENYESFLKDWMTQEPEELVSFAEEIAATKLLSKSIPQVATPEDMEFLMQFENPLEVVRDGWMNYEQADISHELKFALSYAKNTPELLECYAKADEQTSLASDGKPPTVREFLEQHPNGTFDMMAPGGYVYLTPEKAQRLLAGESVMGNPGCPGCDMKITAEELLDQNICNANFSKGVWNILSNTAPEQEQTSSGMEVTMC